MDGSFVGVAGGKICRVRAGDVLCPAEDEEFWRRYFGLGIPYEKINRTLIESDPRIAPCISFGKGLRILRQELWETIVSFIFSSNNLIPRIRTMIETLCAAYGRPLEFDGRRYYTFPSAEALSGLRKEDFAFLHAGYRDAYLLDAVEKVAGGKLNLLELETLPTAEAKQQLMQIKGVGPKVADCILLFALGRYAVFPQDVWIKRILKDVYAVEGKETQNFIVQTYGAYGGFAQQYLYHFYRNYR